MLNYNSTKQKDFWFNRKLDFGQKPVKMIFYDCTLQAEAGLLIDDAKLSQCGQALRGLLEALR